MVPVVVVVVCCREKVRKRRIRRMKLASQRGPRHSHRDSSSNVALNTGIVNMVERTHLLFVYLFFSLHTADYLSLLRPEG